MQADVQNELGEPMRKAIKEAGAGAEQKNDSRFPSVVPGTVCEWLEFKMSQKSVLNVNDNGDIRGDWEHVHVFVYYVCMLLDDVQFSSHFALP